MMKIIDSNGVEIANPDLTKGYLKPATQTIRHDAVAGVEEVSHYETLAEYPNGGKDVQKVVDVPGVEAKDAWDDEEQVQVYHLYTAEELAAQAEAREKAEQQAKLPTTDERLTALEAAMLDLLAAQEV
jgi:hypothetical protein